MISTPNPIVISRGRPSLYSAPLTRRRPAIFFDRDGVINERVVGGYVTNWSEFAFLEGIVAVLAELSRLNLPMVVVSNQAGVGKGLMGVTALRAITERFLGAAALMGARIDAVYYCPHAPDEGCDCRKPKPGLILRAARDWRIDLERSALVGDSARDLEAAQAAGCQGILLNTEGEADGTAASREPVVPGTVVVRQVADLSRQVKAMLGRRAFEP